MSDPNANEPQEIADALQIVASGAPDWYKNKAVWAVASIVVVNAAHLFHITLSQNLVDSLPAILASSASIVAAVVAMCVHFGLCQRVKTVVTTKDNKPLP